MPKQINRYDCIIVGAGLCGLALAKGLTAKGRTVLVVEKGSYVNHLGSLLFAPTFYDKGALAKSIEGTIIYRAFGVGGTSLISCANAIVPSQNYINKLGVDINAEIEDTVREWRVSDNKYPLNSNSRRIMEAANALGYKTERMPKFGLNKNCVACGHCELGCKTDAKWTALNYLPKTSEKNLTILPRTTVSGVIADGGKAVGIKAKRMGFVPLNFYADKIILSAGGVGTPIILQNSGIAAGEKFFVDLFNVTYGYGDAVDIKVDPPMNIVCSQFHESEGYILSNFVDNPAGFASSVEISRIGKALNLKKVVGIMAKIGDETRGRVYADGRISKAPTPNDAEKLGKGSRRAREILIKFGITPENIFVTRPRGAHPGGTAAIGKIVNDRFETEIKNLFVCDASLLPESPGIPPMLTLIALVKNFAKRIT